MNLSYIENTLSPLGLVPGDIASATTLESANDPESDNFGDSLKNIFDMMCSDLQRRSDLCAAHYDNISKSRHCDRATMESIYAAVPAVKNDDYPATAWTTHPTMNNVEVSLEAAGVAKLLLGAGLLAAVVGGGIYLLNRDKMSKQISNIDKLIKAGKQLEAKWTPDRNISVSSNDVMDRYKKAFAAYLTAGEGLANLIRDMINVLEDMILLISNRESTNASIQQSMQIEEDLIDIHERSTESMFGAIGTITDGLKDVYDAREAVFFLKYSLSEPLSSDIGSYKKIHDRLKDIQKEYNKYKDTVKRFESKSKSSRMGLSPAVSREAKETFGFFNLVMKDYDASTNYVISIMKKRLSIISKEGDLNGGK